MSDFATMRRMMVDTQVRPSDVTSYPIIQAMLDVKREAFVPANMRAMAYVGDDIALDGGRVILDPRVFAKMLEVLDIQPDEMVLDIGSTLGYSAAVLAKLSEFVVAVDNDASLCAEAERSLVDQDIYNAAIYEGALNEGAEKHAPFDAMILEGAIAELPGSLSDQLKDGGRVVAIFDADGMGVVRLGRKISGHIVWRDSFNASAPVLPGFERAAEFAL